MNHLTIILPSGHQHFTTEGRYIKGENVQACARTAAAARLAVFTLAGECDAAVIRAERWARVGLIHCQQIAPSNPSAPVAAALVSAFRQGVLASATMTAAQRMQVQMCAEEGAADYREAWQSKMDRWLAAHPVKPAAPAPEPRRFIQPAGPQVDRLSA